MMLCWGHSSVNVANNGLVVEVKEHYNWWQASLAPVMACICMLSLLGLYAACDDVLMLLAIYLKKKKARDCNEWTSVKTDKTRNRFGKDFWINPNLTFLSKRPRVSFLWKSSDEHILNHFAVKPFETFISISRYGLRSWSCTCQV